MIAPRTTWDLGVRHTPPGGRHAWLEALHTTHGPGLRHMLRRMLSNEEEVRDVYQECMYRLARRSHPAPPRCVPAYAYRTAANLATETIRQRGRRGAHWDRIITDHRARRDLHDTAPPHSSDEARRRALVGLRRAVNTLPRHLHDVIVLRDLVQLPYRQVARIMGIGPGTARVYRRQAVVRLGNILCPSAHHDQQRTPSCPLRAPAGSGKPAPLAR